MTHLYADPVFQGHETPPGHPEAPERARAVSAALVECPQVTSRHLSLDPSAETNAALELVHDPGYIAAIEAAAASGGKALDSDTFVSPASYEIARRATATLLGATRASLAAEAEDSARQAFVVVRPPGHHARPARGMGFCLFNHVAVAAADARRAGLERVTVLDFDVHHGNGTQEMFWSQAGVQYVSIHGKGYYPGTGAEDETGEGDGLGTTLNVPLPSDTSPEDYQLAFASAMRRVSKFNPELLLVSAGFDAYVEDPVGGLGLAPEHFHWIGAELRAVAEACCGGRLVSVLEGGYDIGALGGLAQAYVEGQASA